MSEFHVLLADDSPTVLGMLSYVLASSGYDVETAEDGMDLLKCAFRRPPDLVITEVHLPKLSGTQACRLLKARAATRDTPVVLFTSQESGLERLHALRAGADRFVLKDAAPEEIARVAGECLKGRSARGLPGPGEASAPLPEDAEILSHVNAVLESKLFEAVLFNEIARVGKEAEEFESTIRAMDDVLLEIAPHDAMGVVFSDGISLESVTVFPRPASERLRRTVADWTARLREEAGVPVSPNRVKETELLLGGPGPADDGRTELLRPWVVCPIRSGETVKGLLVLFSREMVMEGRPAEALLRHGFMVMQSAWLYHQISLLSDTDGLTGLFNHRRFVEALKKEHARSARYRLSFSMLMLDIDHFKRINDVYGHPVGDTVLREMAAILTGHFRETDLAARYGGEEFAILLPETTGIDAAMVAGRLREVVERKVFAAPSPLLHCTVSIGVSAFDPERPVSEKELLARADEALYNAKREGRNRVCSR